jgi:hypothetical protein
MSSIQQKVVEVYAVPQQCLQHLKFRRSIFVAQFGLQYFELPSNESSVSDLTTKTRMAMTA